MACRRITRRSPARSGSNWCTSRSLDEIAQLNRVASMGELTASLAHELNQPQAAILSNAQAANRFLGGKCPDLEQARECLTDFVSDDKRRRGDPAIARPAQKRGAGAWKFSPSREHAGASVLPEPR